MLFGELHLPDRNQNARQERCDRGSRYRLKLYISADAPDTSQLTPPVALNLQASFSILPGSCQAAKLTSSPSQSRWILA